MAVKKIQMRPSDNNYADVLHPETDTTMVLLPDGSVLQDQLVAPLASGSATELVIDMPGITSYTHLKLFQFIASANNNGAASTLKVGTLPARPIYLEGTTNTAPTLIAGKLYTVWADNGNNCFFLKASGSGNAVAADLLAGKTATTDNGPIVGTMPSNGSQDAILEITGSAKPTKVVPAGYTPGGTITAQLSSTLADKILAGNNIGGVNGTIPVNASQDAILEITGSAKPTKVVPAGYTPGGTITAQLSSTLADKILAGNTIGGVVGTLKTPLSIMASVKDLSTIENFVCRDVAYGNGLFVAVGERAKLCTSTDAKSWNSQTVSALDQYDAIRGVAYGNGLWVAVADGTNSGKIITSPDGTTWTLRHSEPDCILESALYAGGKWLVTGSWTGGYVVISSTNGTSWTAVTPSSGSRTILQSLIYVADKWYALDPDYYNGSRILTSSDGVNFTTCYTSPIFKDLWTLIYADGLFLAGGTELVQSTNGVNWTVIKDSLSPEIRRLAYADGLYVQGLSDGKWGVSLDLTTWKITSEGNTDYSFRKILTFDRKFIFVRTYGNSDTNGYTIFTELSES
jgi:hypothetical protein